MKNLLLVLSFILYSLSTHGQSISSIEKQLINYSNEIDKWERIKFDDDNYDSLQVTNTALLEYLKSTAINNPSILIAPFKGLDKTNIHIVSSADKKIRVFWWNTATGGTCRFYNAILVYRIGKSSLELKVLNDISKDNYDHNDPGEFYLNIYTFHTLDGKTIYLFEGMAIEWSSCFAFDMQAYAIRNGRLIDDVPFFKTQTRRFNTIGFETDYSANVNRDAPDHVEFKMSKDNKTLYVPLIKDNGRITNKFLVYKFNGHQFVYDKNAK